LSDRFGIVLGVEDTFVRGVFDIEEGREKPTEENDLGLAPYRAPAQSNTVRRTKVTHA
jgi:hypothetical protein